MAALLLLTNSNQASAEVMPALALLSYRVRVLPGNRRRCWMHRRWMPCWWTVAATW